MSATRWRGWLFWVGVDAEPGASNGEVSVGKTWSTVPLLDERLEPGRPDRACDRIGRDRGVVGAEPGVWSIVLSGVAAGQFGSTPTWYRWPPANSLPGSRRPSGGGREVPRARGVGVQSPRRERPRSAVRAGLGVDGRDGMCPVPRGPEYERIPAPLGTAGDQAPLERSSRTGRCPSPRACRSARSSTSRENVR